MNPIVSKSYSFALKVVKLYKHLSEEKNESVLSSQFLRSGTNIGANLEEVSGGHSMTGLSKRIDVAYKESCGTKYWLRLLHDNDYIKRSEFEELFNDCDELSKQLSGMLKNIKIS